MALRTNGLSEYRRVTLLLLLAVDWAFLDRRVQVEQGHNGIVQDISPDGRQRFYHRKTAISIPCLQNIRESENEIDID